MSIPEPILVVYSELPKAIAATDLRQSRVDEFLASRSLQPKSRKAYQADLRIFMDWCDLAWGDVSRRKVTQFKTFLLKERELALSSVNRVLRTLKSFYRWMLLFGLWTKLKHRMDEQANKGRINQQFSL